jgi:hypothetical protein
MIYNVKYKIYFVNHKSESTRIDGLDKLFLPTTIKWTLLIQKNIKKGLKRTISLLYI